MKCFNIYIGAVVDVVSVNVNVGACALCLPYWTTILKLILNENMLRFLKYLE